MIRLLIILIALSLNSCSCDWHLKRAKSKCGNVLSDTLIVHDTLNIKSIEKDTVFNYLQKDTVIIREGRLTMKYFYNTKDSTVYINGKCDTVKIIREIQVPYEKTVIKLDYFPKWLMWCIIALVVGLLIFKFLNK